MSLCRFSPDRLHRYTLCRDSDWPDPERRTLNFICLNPSTADEERNDPTVTRLIQRTTLLGYSRLVVTNIFAWRATDPKELKRVEDPIGPENDAYLLSTARHASMVVCAWGKTTVICSGGGLPSSRCRSDLSCPTPPAVRDEETKP